MPNADAATVRRQILRRLRSGEKVAAIAAETGVSRSTLYRWKREGARAATKAPVQRRRMRAARMDKDGAGALK